MPRKVLVVAAHADDEVLGMAGTIARHVASGDSVGVAFLTDGISSRGQDLEASEARRSAAGHAAATVGCRIVDWASFPDNAMDSVPLLEVVRWVESVAESWSPDMVYTHFHGDLNIDHAVTCRAVLTAFRPEPSQGVTEILGFEVLSSSEWAFGDRFEPDTFVDVSEMLDSIVEAYGHYDAEHRADPHARSSEALVLRRQARGRTVGVRAAEAFVTYRRLLRPTFSRGDI